MVWTALPAMLSAPRILVLAAAVLAASACGEVWNDPYPAADRGRNILYSAFTDRPKHLDPVQSYSEDEAEFNAQIYEPPLQYHYLKRPYTLVPMTAEEVPRPQYLDAAGLPVDADSPEVAFSVYEIRIRKGIRYQPHPAFARDAQGRLLYHAPGTRELTAEDYVYQIKRLAHPRLHSPIFGLMSEYIVGLKELAATLKAEDEALAKQGRRDAWLDLSKYPLEGVEVVDSHTYRIRVKGRYPQFAYWLAMNFFAPVPIEADRFFSQPGMSRKNLVLDWYPIGTGPFMLTENNPNARMVLERNPNYRAESYPCEGEPGDREAGLLADCGRPIPFIDRVVFTREKEAIPYWNKFLQGYYDSSGIASDNFDQAVRVSIEGETAVSPEMEAKGIRLETSVETSSRYMAFNWLDPVVGGLGATEAERTRARKLRQAISIAIDWEEFVSIFANGRGIPGQGPIPPGIFGYRDGREGMNPLVYEWEGGRAKRRSIETAQALLAQAGYPNGRLNVQLEIRGTDYNRFQEKVRKGAAQIFIWGWNADYPDPENFLFLFVGSQSRAKFQGENAANYANPEYDRLFDQVKHMENGPQRQALIDRMVEILREDAPWSFGYHPKAYGLLHDWMGNAKPNHMARNDLKYRKIDAALRERQRAEWNRPVIWPLAVALLVLAVSALPAIVSWRRRERAAARAA